MERAIRLGPGALVLLFGVYRLLERRHPRALARIPPTRLAWWSFLMATAHGAGLMLVPFMLGLCGPAGGGMAHARALDECAGAIRACHRAGGRGGAHAGDDAGRRRDGLGVYRYLGLQFLRRAWFNLDLAWAASLVLAGAAGMGMAL